MIEVYDGAQALEVVPADLVRLPDGRLGALWHGQAFPLIDGKRIDVAGEFVVPGRCTRLALVGDATHEEAGWTLIPGVDACYLLFGGDGARRDRIVAGLRSEGMPVERVGRHFPDDDADGAAFSWFVRLGVKGNDEAVRGRIAGVVAGSDDGTAAPMRDAPGTRLALLERELRMALAREREARAALDRLQLDAAAADARSRQALEAERRRRAQAEEEAKAAEELVASLGDAHPLQDEAAKPDPVAPAQRPALGKRIRAEVEAIVTVFLSDMELIGDSIHFISVEVSDRQPLYRHLRDLRDNPDALRRGWKAVQGVKGWWERHFSTGEADDGRIYAQQRADSGGWRVLVSDKASQRRDLERLRR